MEACLPLDKVDKCIGIISDFLKRKKVTLREVQSLTGFLNFACSVNRSRSGPFYFIVQMLKGYGKVGFRLDSRLPLTLPILHRLVQAAAVVAISRENAALFWPCAL